MAWAQEDVDAVKAAIIALVSGKRAVSVSFTGPPARTVSYQAVELDKLRAILAEMERSVSGAPRFSRFAFSKGFDAP